MLVQFVASYGHLHPEDFDFLVHGHGALTISAGHGPMRAIGDPMDADLDCPICSSMQLLGSTPLPDGVHLVPRLVRDAIQTAVIDEFWLIPPAHLSFETRGPPLT
jgi:hypothetical protein